MERWTNVARGWAGVAGMALALVVVAASPAHAQETPLSENPYFDMTIEELLQVDLGETKQTTAALYGFVRANVERVFRVPSLDSGGNTVYASDPLEWSTPAFNLYGAMRPTRRFDILFNIAGSETDLELRNSYGNITVNKTMQVRLGRMYRRFGLFNDKLDQFPTFLGIEPPELVDQDHLMLPRTTVFAVHGAVPVGAFQLRYFVDTDNGEAGAQPDVYPLGWDLRVAGSSFVAGTSGYLSSLGGGATSSTRAVGEGSPRGGVMPWMAGDNYVVVGAFVEYQFRQVLLQTEYSAAIHHATRDPDSVLDVVRNAGINAAQRSRFLGANAGTPDDMLTTADVVVDADYTVQTFYARVGYTIHTPSGSVTPYAFIDWMKHPEAIRSKTYGGDNEAGFADDGQFWKPSLGVVYKPITEVALKLDGSAHIQTFNGKTELYPEFRFDASFAFKLLE